MKNINNNMFNNYLDDLINKIYKILPLKESNADTLNVYLNSLQVELIGSIGLIEFIQNDSQYMSLLSTIQYLIDNKYSVDTCKREVFKCINIIKKLKKKYIIL